MKKIVTFSICFLAALAVDFLREGITSRVYAQLQKADESQAVTVKGSYPAPNPLIESKIPYPVSGKTGPAGAYPSPVSRPMDKNAGEPR